MFEADRPARRGLLSLPTVVAAAALTLVGAGALAVGTSTADPTHHRAASLASASFIAGTATGSTSGSTTGYAHGSTTGYARGSSAADDARVLAGRGRAVSRDSSRDALHDVTRQALRPAAEQQGKETNAALAALAASAEKQAGLIAKDAWQLPVTAGAYHLTARFGQCSALWSHCHTGLDFAAPTGTPIRAVANGTISQEGWAGPYGNRIIETLPDGSELWYCHQSGFVAKPGQPVTAGQVIGLVGATGNVTGPHLHLEVRPGAGDPVDPFQALVAHGLKP